MRIAVIVGTRPEAIKIAPVIYQLRRRSDVFDVVVVTTAQHREMLDQALSLFGIIPAYDLNLMYPGQSLAGITSRIIDHMDSTLGKIHPDMVLVQGDTSTVFISALAAFYRAIPVTHVEAGLRSYDLKNPFPEEANRRLTSVLAEINCAPTALARNRLLQEGVSPQKIIVTGNTAVDALQHMLDMPFSFAGSPLEKFNFEKQRTVLVTCHRRESWGRDIEEIFLALTDVANKFSDVQIIYPVHLNPEVQHIAQKILSNIDRIHLVPPLDYLTFINLMKRSDLILTDSGGIQEEAPTFGTPLLVLRSVTERPEALEWGLTKVIGTTREAIVKESSHILKDGGTAAAVIVANPYGDGMAASRITEAIERWSRGLHPLLEPEREFIRQRDNSIL